MVSGSRYSMAACSKALAEIPFSSVMVEEAAEIMEPHVLAALPRTAERLIMIGDHLQLRPKVNAMHLQVRTPAPGPGLPRVCMYVCMYDYIAVSTRTLTPPTRVRVCSPVSPKRYSTRLKKQTGTPARPASATHWYMHTNSCWHVSFYRQ